ncbi:protein gar2-like [Nicotiana sylvestris]|uniref:protein gar2-like n=1 Tax=Nicotiana sylvestris TaxID=4096 RepID=UPI00388CB219
MTNPQDNPGTPPPVSPSNTSSSTPPSKTPKPKFRRQKMLARKTVASGALRKVLNEKLKASKRKESPTQESDSSFESEAFISTSEGGEHGSSNTTKIQETPGEVSSCVVLSTVVENVENRFVLVGPVKDVKGAESSRSGGKKKKKEGASDDERGNGKEKVMAISGGVEEGGNKSGGSGSGEAAEGLVHLSKQQDEPGSSVEETLADLLKRVGASYDPKKRKASTQKAPTASKPIKKSKMSFPKPTIPSVPKGRATRSRVRQSEAELQKALVESKKKKKEKGKAKVVESYEVAEE